MHALFGNRDDDRNRTVGCLSGVQVNSPGNRSLISLMTSTARASKPRIDAVIQAAPNTTSRRSIMRSASGTVISV
jgi:hypothetical protein